MNAPADTPWGLFDAWLRDDAAARAWLDGDGPRSLLAAGDHWQRK